MGKRIAISKSVRFEVFKRDSFTCKYCGAKAPEVVLHVDHIKPVVEGGDNEIVNLITSCVACNLGKGPRSLADTSILDKSRAQMEELQERREQLELMMAWREGLTDLKSETANKVKAYFEQFTPGSSVTESGAKNIKGKWLKYSLAEVLEAIDRSSEQYIKIKDGKATPESVGTAFDMVPRICSINKASEEKPYLRDLFYIRAILRNRLEYVDGVTALQWMEVALSWGVTIDELKSASREARSFSNFSRLINQMIAEHKAGNR